MQTGLLEQFLNYSFKNKKYLKEALTHPSLNTEHNKRHDYERLELLGDSILTFVITDILLKKFPKLSEGQLVQKRSIIVSKDILHKISLEINLGDFILMSKGEEISGGRQNLNNLTNVLEALIAAIYLDSNVQQIYQIINSLWNKHLDDVDVINSDPKTFLQEWAQSRNYDVPKYDVIKKCGENHAPTFTVKLILDKFTVVATGQSIKHGEKNAARKFISKFLKKKTLIE